MLVSYYLVQFVFLNLLVIATLITSVQINKNRVLQSGSDQFASPKPQSLEREMLVLAYANNKSPLIYKTAIIMKYGNKTGDCDT